MKTKPIPESWHGFHRLVIIHSHNPKWSLNRCVSEAGCSARMPRIYWALGWISSSIKNQWTTNIVVNLTPEMAEQIREISKRMENASDPLGVKIKEWKKTIGNFEENIPTLEETKEKISRSMSGKQAGNKNSQYGSCWITNGMVSKKIKKDDPIPEG